MAKRLVNPALSSAAILRASVAEMAVALVRIELHKHAEVLGVIIRTFCT